MGGDDTTPVPPDGLSDAALWRHGRVTDVVEDEAERYLDLAGFADGRLDPDDRERVGEWLASDPVAADDVAAARVLPAPIALPEVAIARACGLVTGNQPQRDTVIPFPPSRRYRPRLHSMARWGSLVAAMAVASWLGFALGMDTSLSFAQVRQTGEDTYLGELLDPSTDFLTEGTQT
jgi:hypothetical protein